VLEKNGRQAGGYSHLVVVLHMVADEVHVGGVLLLLLLLLHLLVLLLLLLVCGGSRLEAPSRVALSLNSVATCIPRLLSSVSSGWRIAPAVGRRRRDVACPTSFLHYPSDPAAVTGMLALACRRGMRRHAASG